MNVGVIGTGYVGLVTGACLARMGHNVICSDIDEEKISKLKEGIVPIYEPGLTELVRETLKAGNLKFTYSNRTAIRESKVIFLAVPTPSDDLGETNINALLHAALDIRTELEGTKDVKIIVVKSTVPVGTNEKIEQLIWEGADNFQMVSNPEFLREGSAVHDFFFPDRVVIGTRDAEAKAAMTNVYDRLIAPILHTSIPTAELVKYASNAFLAVKIAYINSMADLCTETGANIEDISHIMGLDPRIGPDFLKPGPGFGGSCFPKDTRALAYFSDVDYGVPQTIVEQCFLSNDYRPIRLFNELILPVLVPSPLARASESCLDGKTIGVLGVAFKANTDDVRESPILEIMGRLDTYGAKVRCYDPKAMENAEREVPFVTFCDSAVECSKGTDALIIGTEWNEFKNLDLSKLEVLTIIDLRNLYDPEVMAQAGFNYASIGRV